MSFASRKRSLRIGATIVAVIGICVVVANFGTRAWRELHDVHADIAQSCEKVSTQQTSPVEPSKVMATKASPLAKALGTLSNDAGAVTFAARASDDAYRVVTWTGEGSDAPRRYWNADAREKAAKVVFERQLGPAPVYSYSPYELNFGYLRMKSVGRRPKASLHQHPRHGNIDPGHLARWSWRFREGAHRRRLTHL